MSRPQAYSPEYGYRYQLLCRHATYARAYEHCDYAKDRAELKHLRENYLQAYGAGWEFQAIQLPRKYWNASNEPVAPAISSARFAQGGSYEYEVTPCDS
jgi:hypothetical protein